jgi:hypothetical protein
VAEDRTCAGGRENADGKVTRQAVNKFLAEPELAAAVKSEKNRLIRAEQERKRWERTRRKLAREGPARHHQFQS